VYLVDFGVSAATDETGIVLGYFGTYAYGTVSYAPHVGPIASYERDFVWRTDAPDPETGAGDFTIVLTERPLAGR
jgi:hypothetical protein